MRKDKGFIGIFIVVIAALALLKYFFDWSIFDAINSERGQNTMQYIRDVISIAWSYVEAPTLFVWEKIKELFNR